MNRLLSILKYSSFLCISVFLMWYALRELDFERMWVELQQANYIWIVLSMAMGAAAYMSRAHRWKLQIVPTGVSPSFANTYHAMMVGYLANLVLPRMGEVIRCSILKRTDNLPVNKALGTVIAERFIDMLMLLVCVGLTFLFELDKVVHYFIGLFTDQYQSLERSLDSWYLLLLLLVLGLGSMVVGVLFLSRLRNNFYFQKAVVFVKGMLQGIFSITRIKNQPVFWGHTLFIWLMFYGTTLIVFYALPATSGLSATAGLSVLVAGTLGMAAPVQGGIGVYHLAVQTTLLLYGVPKEAGMAYALLAHTSQTLLVVLMGVLSFIVTMLQRVRPAAQKNETNTPIHEVER
ncbi:lysylphosphatidylglycerol synthase transmembrane domain-containing protein [Pontibacter beigongshangensis]|uniref:lysylphosphatidylglycerol synthase transmembrane domain-containing protein n=1 Tax=Pontibacter beigongshangensis TaxID=2574733 RepID=UPI00164FBE7E|nr:lysylphosphatidylglycerol synthase transmembrane domain-containing protein [Pontibacter beigongshangensis]